MARTFFKNQLASKATLWADEKKGAARSAEETSEAAKPEAEGEKTSEEHNVEEKSEESAETKPEGPREAPKKVEVYDDATVCRLLGVRRKVLVDARKSATRGKDWDCENLHAGMTKDWIENYAAANGAISRYLKGEMKPIQPNDGVVTVEVVGALPNPNLMMVEVVATKERRFCAVRNQYQPEFQHHLHEQFDCVNIEGKLEWVATLNMVKRY